MQYLLTSAKWEQDYSCGNIKDGVHICDLRSRICRVSGDHPVYKWRYHTQYHKYNCTDYIEHQMDGCGTLCISVGSHRSQNSRDTSTDILTEQYEHSAVKTYHAAYSQCL